VLRMEKQDFLTTYHYEPGLAPELSDPALVRLLSLFPHAAPVRIPIRVGLPVRAKGASEKSTIMFGVNDTVIFTLDYPLNCGEAVKVRHSAGSAGASAVVVAIMPKERGVAVAARFYEGAPKWFPKA